MARPHKYHAVPTVVDGIRFASKKEARRYSELKLLERAGEIANLELQPRFELHAPGGTKVGEYRADFRYTDKRSGEIVVEDVKGMKTPTYRLKKKHTEAEYGIEVREV